MSTSWIIVSSIVFVTGVVLLVFSIRRMQRCIDDAILFSAPCVNHETVYFRESGEVTLHLVGPALSLGHLTLKFHLWHPGTGTYVSTIPSLRLRKSKGFSRSKTPVGTFRITAPGEHTVVIEGLAEGKRYNRYELVFARAYGPEYAGRAVAVFASLVLTAIGFTGLFISWAVTNHQAAMAKQQQTVAEPSSLE